MRETIYNIAEYVYCVSAPRLITDDTKAEVKLILAYIQGGTSAKNFVDKRDVGKPEMKKRTSSAKVTTRSKTEQGPATHFKLTEKFLIILAKRLHCS